MLEVDIPVWWRWLQVYYTLVQSLYYDVLLGGPFYTEEELKDPMRRMWYHNIAKRADALIETRDEVWIVEVASDPGLRAIGQLQSYRALWLRDPKIMKPERLHLVADHIEIDLLDVCGMYGIQPHIV